MKKYLSRHDTVTEPMFLAKYHPRVGQAKALYGLPLEVKFCTNCVISNQRPSSTVEYKSNKKQKKSTLLFDDNGVWRPIEYAEGDTVTSWINIDTLSESPNSELILAAKNSEG